MYRTISTGRHGTAWSSDRRRWLMGCRVARPIRLSSLLHVFVAALYIAATTTPNRVPGPPLPAVRCPVTALAWNNEINPAPDFISSPVQPGCVAIDSFKWITADQSTAYGCRRSRRKPTKTCCLRPVHKYTVEQPRLLWLSLYTFYTESIALWRYIQICIIYSSLFSIHQMVDIFDGPT